MMFDYTKIVDDLRRWNSMFGGGVPTQAEIEAAMRGEVDSETMSLMRSYCHTLDRRTVTHTAADINPDDWPLCDFEKVITDFIASVPADKRSIAKVELKGGYEESTELVVTYERNQTDEEWAIAVAHALMHARKRQSDDLAVFNRLSKKFQNAK